MTTERDPFPSSPPFPSLLSNSERAIYRRYASLALPRHTSYPIAPCWSQSHGPLQHAEALRSIPGRGQPIALYVHIPYCEQLCYYCACTREIVPLERRRQADPSAPLLDTLALEMKRVADHVRATSVTQIHWGGGSPTFLKSPDLLRLATMLRDHFAIDKEAEWAIEVDPRITSREQLEMLRGLGRTRISLGIQDFDPGVQQAVHRHQPFELVERFMGWCRDLEFESVNFDLIYGLPYQTVETMAATLERTISLGPDRIAFYRLAVIPEMFQWQQTFCAADLPAGDLVLDLNLLAIEGFQRAGYQFIGLDHFARPDEALARARDDGSLRRNFQGMTTRAEQEIVGLGPSAISQLASSFAQNHKTTAEWRRGLADDLPTERGIELTSEDLLRRRIIEQIYAYGHVNKHQIAADFGVDFDRHFASELERLIPLVDDGLVTLHGNELRLTAPLGRLLTRIVAAVFDAYLPPHAFRNGLAGKMSAVG